MIQQRYESNPILKLSFDFSLQVIQFSEQLEMARKFVVARQLLRSATAIGANCMEAQNAESRVDFVHKMKIAAKEAEETQYWLALCEAAPSYPNCTELIASLDAIQKVLGKIIQTAKSNLK